MVAKDQLRERLLRIEQPLFAVLDGAQFEDLPMLLLDEDFAQKPLYNNNTVGNPDNARSAPQLVWLDRDRLAMRSGKATDTKPDTAMIDRVIRLTGDKPSAVFWLFPLGGEPLYRHLRTLNIARIPHEALPADERKRANQSTTAFLFRHADANVMAQVLVGLNASEIARVFGPAISILFAPDEHWSPKGGAIEAKRPANLPRAQPGMLEFSPETMKRIAAARTDGLRRWALNEFAVASGSGCEPASVSQIENAFVRAHAYELEQKDEIWEFIRLDLTYGAGFESKPKFKDARSVLLSSVKSPKERIFYASQRCADAEGN